MQDYGGTKHTGVPVKTLKKLLKKAGLKVSGKKATLTRRAKKARLFGGLVGRTQPRSTVSGLLGTKAMFENSPEQKAARAAAEAEKARQAEALQNAEALNPLAKAEQENYDRKNSQQTLEAEPTDGGKKKKRSRRR
jgi:hypothetical protein